MVLLNADELWGKLVILGYVIKTDLSWQISNSFLGGGGLDNKLMTDGWFKSADMYLEPVQ